MTITYCVILIATLLAGGAAGWLMTTWHYARVRAEHDHDEDEMAEFQDLYAAWAYLHRIQKRDNARNRPRWQ